jgi:GNAT superfamily N-acetyltransferase
MILPAATTATRGQYPICSFFAVTPTSIEREVFDHDLVKRLPFYPVPVFLIAQLAVHVDNLGKGLGKITLIKALEYLWNVNKQMRAFAVIVDCIDDEAQAFYTKYDFQILCDHHGRTRMFMPMGTVAQLFE